MAGFILANGYQNAKFSPNLIPSKISSYTVFWETKNNTKIFQCIQMHTRSAFFFKIQVHENINIQCTYAMSDLDHFLYNLVCVLP